MKAVLMQNLGGGGGQTSCIFMNFVHFLTSVGKI